MTSCGITGVWRSSRRTRFALSIRVLKVEPVLKVLHSTQDLRSRGWSRRGKEALPGVSMPPWKASATSKNHDGWNSTSDSCLCCSRLLGRVKLWPSWLSQANPPVIIAPLGSEWQSVGCVGGKESDTFHSEERWKRSPSRIPSRLHQWLSNSTTTSGAQ